MSLKDDPYKVGKAHHKARFWMELVTPKEAKALAYYDHPAWDKHAAVTRNNHGKGTATYIGFMPEDTPEAILEK